jgi:hypothetical protein
MHGNNVESLKSISVSVNFVSEGQQLQRPTIIFGQVVNERNVPLLLMMNWILVSMML